MSDRRRMIRLVWINTIVVLVLLIAFLGVAFYITNRKAEELETQLQALTESAKTMAAKQEELPNISKRSAGLLVESRKLVKLIPNNPSQKELVAFLQKNVNEANCEVLLLNMKNPVDLPSSIRNKEALAALEKDLDEEIVEATMVIDTVLTVRGGYENALAFMENLKRSDRFFPISKITAPARTGGGGQAFAEAKTVSFELAGNLYYTTVKMDIAERFEELRRSLEEVLPTKPMEQTVEDEKEFIRVEPASGETSGGAEEASTQAVTEATQG